MKQPKQGFDRKLVKEVMDYHEWHGDKKVELKGFVCDPIGSPLLLTRAVDENGNKVSCLLEFEWDPFNATFNVREFVGGDREDEFCMLCRYMSEDE